MRGVIEDTAYFPVHAIYWKLMVTFLKAKIKYLKFSFKPVKTCLVCTAAGTLFNYYTFFTFK